MSKSPFLSKFNPLSYFLNMRKMLGIKEEIVATTYSTYKYQDDHDTEYLRRLLR